MAKLFDEWNIVKKKINARQHVQIFHEREVWWCSLGVNIGYEQDGKNDLFERPVLVIKKFNREVLLVLPLTSTHKDNPYYVLLPGKYRSSIILSQVRLVSSRRLLRLVHKLPHQQYNHIMSRLSEVIIQKQNGSASVKK